MARLVEGHGDAKMTDLLQTLAMPEGALGQYPRSVQGGIRKAGLIGQLDEERLGLAAFSRRGQVGPNRRIAGSGRGTA